MRPYHFMANTWGQSGNSERFYFPGLQNHHNTDYSPEIKTFTPWKKSYDNLSILQSRDITLLTKVQIVKAMVFPVVMYRCESWTIKKSEH